MPLNALVLPFAYASSTIAANKLLIAVRSAYYSSVPGSNVATSDLPMQFKFGIVTSNSTHDHSQPAESKKVGEGAGT